MDTPAIIRKCLDTDDEGLIREVQELLKTAGVEEAEHLKYVKEEDVCAVLSKIKARMFIAALKGETYNFLLLCSVGMIVDYHYSTQTI